MSETAEHLLNEGRDIVLDAEMLAAVLRIPLAQFVAEMRRGNIHALLEKGVAKDAGRHRVRLRYRGREARLILVDGTVTESSLDETAPTPEPGILRDKIRGLLVQQARRGVPITFETLAARLEYHGLRAAAAIEAALEVMTREDALAGRPLLSALAVRDAASELPAPSFFRAAEDAGLFAGSASSDQARAFHRRELHRAVAAGRQGLSCDQSAKANPSKQEN